MVRNMLKCFKAHSLLYFQLVLLMMPFSGISQGTQLPFSEDWSSGNFDSFWTPGDHWIINGQYGNPMPSAEFTWDPMLYNYSSVLMSGDFNGISHETKGEPYIAGSFILEYDLKLNDMAQTGDEYLLCEVWADSLWHTVASYDNGDGSFNWITEEIDITEIAFGKTFKIRFVASGVLSSDILYWNLDNISIKRVCYPPRDFHAEGVDPYTIELNWSSPYTGGGTTAGEWIMWDNSINVGDGIGLIGGGVFSVASHWDADMITQYDGQYITKIRFFPYNNAITTAFTLKVWKGANAGTLVYEEPLNGLLIGEWNEITLVTPVMIDASQELWFGYTADSPAGENPAGYDEGPAVVGYGDMITLDGTTWDPISNLGFDLNWNLHAFIVDITDSIWIQTNLIEDLSIYSYNNGSLVNNQNETAYEPIGLSTQTITGYKIYYNNNGIGYEYLAHTNDTFYFHILEDGFAYGDLECYYVKVVYDDCDANSNEACWFPWVGIEDMNEENEIFVYPNPAQESINIESTYAITKLCFLDLSGRMLQCYELKNETQYSMDVSGYEPGIYLLRIDTEKGRAVRKVVVTE